MDMPLVLKDLTGRVSVPAGQLLWKRLGPDPRDPVPAYSRIRESAPNLASANVDFDLHLLTPFLHKDMSKHRARRQLVRSDGGTLEANAKSNEIRARIASRWAEAAAGSAGTMPPLCRHVPAPTETGW
jgi:hypothetical protein